MRLVASQRHRTYDFGDLLGRGPAPPASAIRAGVSGRRLEDEIEAIARDLGLACGTRGALRRANGDTARATW